MRRKSLQYGFISLFCFHFLAQASGYNYLVVSPSAASSHYHVGFSLVKGLANAGHNITLISAFEQKNPVENIRDVTALGIHKAMEEHVRNLVKNSNRTWSHPLDLYNMGLKITEALLNDSSVLELVQSNQTFDAVIAEVFLNEAQLGLAEHFKAPLIALSAVGAMPAHADLVGTPFTSSYIPHALLHFTDHMNLWERLVNFVFVTFSYSLHNFFVLPQQKTLYRKYFPKNELDFYEMRRNTDLVLVNEHASLLYPRPFAPNMIPVGGMHINRQPPQPLPENIRQFIEEAEHGVIYCSLGSNVKSKTLPLEKRQAFLETFSKLKQRILWKFEDSDLPGRPDNVFISDWFPQDDILANDKVIAFITHGGRLSIMESIYHGKPVVGIPLFGDQFMIIAKVEKSGMGITLKYEDLKGDNLLAATKRLLQDPKFARNVRDMSEKFQDQPETPLERAVWWVEHVTRHKGAKYLKSAAQELNFFQYHSLDILLILFSGLFVIIYLPIKIFLWLLKRFYQLFLKKTFKKAPKIKQN
ncbi:UDP-glycosyltransferase UGT5-like [Drosophila bipectinata]|uniref:UDP-glycosyltransferase UGT5-like n=1 Tax=Drosophila bipectinata TaxID=42026 RepID=UPI0038B254E4